MRLRIILVALALLLVHAIPATGQQKAKHRIVMQLSGSDSTEWKSTVNNIRNLKRAWGHDVQVNVVAHGPGIGFLIAGKTTQHAAIRALKAQGVNFLVCENSLREKKVDKSAVVSEAGFVPVGLGEIVLKQEEGWSYIKAGF